MHTLYDLVELVKNNLPPEVKLLRNRNTDGNIVFYLSISTDFDYGKLERLRKEWITITGWNIAFDPFYYSKELDRQTIATIFDIAPDNHHIKKIDVEGENIVIYTTEVRRLFGKKNKTYKRLRAILPNKRIFIRAADPMQASSNLEEVERAIHHSVNEHKIVKQVQRMVPKELAVRNIGLDGMKKTIYITYGSTKFNGENLEQLTKQISAKTKWKVEWENKVDHNELKTLIEKSIPNSIPKSKVGFHKDPGYFLIRCNGDFTHKPLLEKFVAELNRDLPVEVKYKLIFHDQKIREIITDFIPQQWGLQKISINQNERKVLIHCANTPEQTKQVLDEISQRIGFEVLFQEDSFIQINDENLIAEVCEIIPKICGFVYMVRHVISGEYRIFVRRDRHKIPVRQLKKILKTKQLNVKITEEELSVSKHVKQTLSHIDITSDIIPISRDIIERHAHLTGFGACEEIGRSCFYLELSGLKILLDCGASFGENPYPDIPSRIIRELDFIFLTHAHTDHSALIPWLYRQQCKAQLISTASTFSIARLLMRDYIKVQKKYRNEEPAYSNEDIINALGYARIVDYDQRYRIGDDIHFTFFHAGHILGAGAVLLEDRDQKIFYSGDISLTKTRILQPATIPASGLNHVIIETTYGGKKHPDRSKCERYFISRLLEVLESGGTVIIPCFAVGRSQEILMILSEHPQMGYHKKYPVYVDGMITKVNDIHRSYLASSEKMYFNPKLKLSAKNIFTSGRTFFNNIGKREAILRDHSPKIILSTSGMCEGLSKYYLSAFIEDTNSLLMLVGYQTPESTGRYLLEGNKQLNIDGKKYPVKIQVEQVSFSAHADEEQLLQYLAQQDLDYLISVHGEIEAMDSFITQVKKRKTAKNIVRSQLSQKISIYGGER